MKNDIISIIVPVYNLEKYLKKCIESIIVQDYESKELILVDDGSQDGSGDICDSYARIYSWIKVIHKKNAGLSDARNVGLQNCAGKYITFVDGDDYLNKRYLFYMYELISKYNADIAVCQYEKVLAADDKIFENVSNEKEILLEGLSAVEMLLYQKLYTTSACAKVYKRALFKDIEFPVGRIHEDMGTIYKVFVRSKKTVYLPQSLYYYVQREKSIIHSQFTLQKMDYLLMTIEMVNFFKKEYPQLVDAAFSRHFSACFQLKVMIPDGKFTEENNLLTKEIVGCRKIVLLDKKARAKNRIAALMSCFSVNFAVWLCKLTAEKDLGQTGKR